MPANVSVDDKLVEKARRLGAHKTKKDAVIAALDEYMRRRKQLEILNLFGTIDYELRVVRKANR